MHTDSIAVVNMGREYVEGFHACLDYVARERKYLSFTEAPPLENIRRFIDDNLHYDVPQMVALDAGRVVGWCDIQRNMLEGFEHNGWLGIGLLPDYRAGGLGVRLFNAALDRALALGMWRIEVEVFDSNQRALRFYRKLGFVDEGRKRRARLIDGIEDDVICLALLADPHHRAL